MDMTPLSSQMNIGGAWGRKRLFASSGLEAISRRILGSIERILFTVLDEAAAITVEEYIVSFFPSFALLYCLRRKSVVSNEVGYLSDFKSENFKKVVIVGGGPTPFTALHWANVYCGPVVVLDKSGLAKLLSEKLVKRLGIKNIEILNVRGEDYKDYGNCIVSISLYAQNKEMIVRRVLENKEGNNVIFLRAFIDEACKSFGKEWKVIAQKAHFHTLVLGPNRSPAIK
jgi:hypothetical protein